MYSQLGISMKSTALYSKTRRKKKRQARDPKYRSQNRAEYKRAEDRRLYGSFGAASPVRKIDPATGAVLAVFPAK
jgi:hypothetical protein